MAKLIRITPQNPRRKKWEHFKLKLRSFLFKTSVLFNLFTILYFLYEDGKLTNSIEILKKVVLILGSLVIK